MRFATADVKPQGPAPLLGQHSEQILRDFGMDAAAIAALQDAGTVNKTSSRGYRGAAGSIQRGQPTAKNSAADTRPILH